MDRDEATAPSANERYGGLRHLLLRTDDLRVELIIETSAPVSSLVAWLCMLVSRSANRWRCTRRGGQPEVSLDMLQQTAVIRVLISDGTTTGR